MPVMAEMKVSAGGSSESINITIPFDMIITQVEAYEEDGDPFHHAVILVLQPGGDELALSKGNMVPMLIHPTIMSMCRVHAVKSSKIRAILYNTTSANILRLKVGWEYPK